MKKQLIGAKVFYLGSTWTVYGFSLKENTWLLMSGSWRTAARGNDLQVL